MPIFRQATWFALVRAVFRPPRFTVNYERCYDSFNWAPNALAMRSSIDSKS